MKTGSCRDIERYRGISRDIEKTRKKQMMKGKNELGRSREREVKISMEGEGWKRREKDGEGGRWMRGNIKRGRYNG